MENDQSNWVKHYTEFAETIEDNGAKIRHLISKKSGASLIDMYYVTLDRGQSIPEHRYEFEIELFIIRGKGVIKMENREYILSEGKVVYIPALLKHQIYAEEFLCFISVSPIIIDLDEKWHFYEP